MNCLIVIMRIVVPGAGKTRSFLGGMMDSSQVGLAQRATQGNNYAKVKPWRPSALSSKTTGVWRACNIKNMILNVKNLGGFIWQVS
jgi:hypothetical protein